MPVSTERGAQMVKNSIGQRLGEFARYAPWQVGKLAVGSGNRMNVRWSASDQPCASGARETDILPLNNEPLRLTIRIQGIALRAPVGATVANLY